MAQPRAGAVRRTGVCRCADNYAERCVTKSPIALVTPNRNILYLECFVSKSKLFDSYICLGSDGHEISIRQWSGAQDGHWVSK